ncbi:MULTISPECIES: AAA family ATPase [Enterobacterales]|uniref:AAA family ATPase n=1 Tax=Enterobacterales TaxID=91347 RepID=UPI0018DF857E|nr:MULTISPECIES: AAA family ATPase [Enterobacterales]MBI0552111.1 AAA family ATPase [Pectobacterium parmentieri]MBI0561197.1 AAA family ATPase [Pectobacterium parmentieri]MBI0565402.1 AAA family ATPase [Pectobacterium parmentieri]
MSNKPKIRNRNNLHKVVELIRDDLRQSDNGGVDVVLLYAYNGTGKTRLSMEFKNAGKRKRGQDRDTLYFNAFTEDLFHWDNDLAGDANRVLQINSDSKFFEGFKELALEEKIFTYLARYSNFNFKVDYDNWNVSFSKLVKNPRYRPESEEPETIVQDNIKISRGEENIFIWCVFLAICELVIDGAEAYNWVKYFYIDDPISSLDDNNAIAIGSDLAKLLKRSIGKVKTVISSHHSLFFNVMCNELKKQSHKSYFIYSRNGDGYSLQSTTDTPFFHHVAMLSELKKAADAGRLYTNHFNVLRGVLEKTSAFFGFKDFSGCIHGIDDEVLFSRALNLLSHGDYSLFDPKELTEDNKQLFNSILNGFLERYAFDLPDIHA